MGNQQDYAEYRQWVGGEFAVLNKVGRRGLIEQMTLSKDLKKVRGVKYEFIGRNVSYSKNIRVKNLRQEHD